MRKLITVNVLVLFLIVTITLISSGCRKKAFDEFYGRPDSLAQPIYQVLKAKGKFTNLIACIDKAGYKDILGAAGYWTFFAPNDSAFQAFFKERGITSVDQLDSGTAQKIVTFALVYNAFPKARLNDYQSNAGWVTNNAFRRRTANYTGFYDDTTLAGVKVKAIGSNRNNSFIVGDNNNKYLTYFMTGYFTAKNLTATDFNYFYPNTTYTGFNIPGGAVVNSDIVAENGYIHETNKVLLPLQSIDQYLAANSQYSEFKKIFDKYLVSFILNTDATNRYKLITGNSDGVYVKTFATGVGFSLNNENFIKAQDNDGQSNCYTLFAPKNDVLLAYVKNVLLENYTSLDVVPMQIILDFVNSHICQSAVWPSKFSVTNNALGEPSTINNSTDIADKQILSNGFFYGTNKVQEANVFRTVYGRSYLDPNYLLMTRALDANYRYTVTIPSLKFTMIMMSDAVLRTRGYDYSSMLSAWTYTTPGTTTLTSGSAPYNAIQRTLATHIVLTPNGELDDLSGSGIIETLGGEYIKWNAGKFTSAGSQDSSYTVNASGTKTSYNGRVYYANNLLTYSVKTIGARIKELGASTSSQFNYFYQLLASNSNYNATTGDIINVQVGTFYTLFIPTNAAIMQAVKDGVLPGNTTTGAPNFAPTAQSDINLVNNFIYYHFLNKTTVVPDGKKAGTYESLFKKASGDAAQFIISNAANSMQVTDNYNRKANVVVASSNNLADRCVIHLIDNYLKYNPN
jgi:uncharacterized surface protein with fasciclin (FAS1) repeats